MMGASAVPGLIFLVGNDERLTYLLLRYFESGNYTLIPSLTIPTVTEVIEKQPCTVIFSTIELLEGSQTLLEYASAHDLPVLVCTSVADEARARELGADACLVHPLTYENFNAALSVVFPLAGSESGLLTKSSGF